MRAGAPSVAPAPGLARGLPCLLSGSQQLSQIGFTRRKLKEVVTLLKEAVSRRAGIQTWAAGSGGCRGLGVGWGQCLGCCLSAEIHQECLFKNKPLGPPSCLVVR